MICIPLKLRAFNEAKKLIKAAEKHADIIELWLDQIAPSHIPEILNYCQKAVIVNNKGRKEQGHFSGNEVQRIGRLQLAAEHGADYLDIGIHTAPKLIQALIKNKNRSQIIISYHNFQTTPPLAELKKIVTKIAKFQPDIIKIATTAHRPEDNLTLAHLTQYIQKIGKQPLTLCMGKIGQPSRILLPMIGSIMAFAALDHSQATAPGQLTVAQLKQIWQTLGWKPLKKPKKPKKA